MGYMLPLRYIKVSQKATDNGQTDVAICATRIVAIMSTDAYQARRTIQAEKRAGTLINAAGRSPVKSAIFLDNGTVIASPQTVNRLLTAIEKSNFKAVGMRQTNESSRIRVYDAVFQAPPMGPEDEVPEMSIEGGKSDYAGELIEDIEEDMKNEKEVFADDYL